MKPEVPFYYIELMEPRAGPVFALMKSTRTNFKLALRQSRSDTKTKDADSLAQKSLSKDQKQFWDEVKKINLKEDYNVVANTLVLPLLTCGTNCH